MASIRYRVTSGTLPVTVSLIGSGLPDQTVTVFNLSYFFLNVPIGTFTLRFVDFLGETKEETISTIFCSTTTTTICYDDVEILEVVCGDTTTTTTTREVTTTTTTIPPVLECDVFFLIADYVNGLENLPVPKVFSYNPTSRTLTFRFSIDDKIAPADIASTRTRIWIPTFDTKTMDEYIITLDPFTYVYNRTLHSTGTGTGLEIIYADDNTNTYVFVGNGNGSQLNRRKVKTFTFTNSDTAVESDLFLLPPTTMDISGDILYNLSDNTFMISTLDNSVGELIGVYDNLGNVLNSYQTTCNHIYGLFNFNGYKYATDAWAGDLGEEPVYSNILKITNDGLMFYDSLPYWIMGASQLIDCSLTTTTTTTTLEITTTTTSILPESFVLLNPRYFNNKVYNYNPTSKYINELSMPYPFPDFTVDIAHTSNKLWTYGRISQGILEFDITFSPWSATLSRSIVFDWNYYSYGLCAKDNNTLILINETNPLGKVYEADITTGTIVYTYKFDLQNYGYIAGDYLLTTTGKLILITTSTSSIFLTQYDYATGNLEMYKSIESLGVALGIFEYNDEIYVGFNEGDVYKFDLEYPYNSTYVDNTLGISGASQIPSECTVHFEAMVTTTTTTTI